MTASYEQLRQRAAEFSQEHLFQYWDSLDEPQRAALLEDVAGIDFERVARLASGEQESAAAAPDLDAVKAPPIYPVKPRPEHEELYAQAVAEGQAALRDGKVAAMVVAGGQGTRLGFDGPKGTFCVSPVKKKPLFVLFAENLRAVEDRYGKPIPWYIMTSSATDAPTRAYFEENNYLGLAKENVFFFQQGLMPAVDGDGRILLADRHRVALSPNGHGGSLTAMRDSGALADMRARGVEAVSYFQVDNPLVAPVDPQFIGLHRLAGSQISSVAVPKVDDLEKVGNFAMLDGKVCVIEYSDLPDALAHARNADGTRMLDAGNIAIHLFDVGFVEELTAGGSMELPWHIAKKKVAHIDLATGQPVEPAEPNARKFEMFVFDAIPLATESIVVERLRSECFSPVKNAEGVDSAVTARRDMILRALRWLEQAGATVPPMAGEDPAATVEISPLLAVSAADLADRLTGKPTIKPGDVVYLE